MTWYKCRNKTVDEMDRTRVLAAFCGSTPFLNVALRLPHYITYIGIQRALHDNRQEFTDTTRGDDFANPVGPGLLVYDGR